MHERRVRVLVFRCTAHERSSERDDTPLPVPRDSSCQACKGTVPSGADHWCAECQLTGHEFQHYRDRWDHERRLLQEAEKRKARRGPITFQPRIKRRHAMAMAMSAASA